jgi:drug/metabolite transporter (DMT)-like permease
MRKAILWYAGLILTFAVFVIAFGYLDGELNEGRRWFGLALIAAGMAIVIPAARRLISDWPRMKPRHNVDVAFVQIIFGISILWVACLLGGRAEAFLAPLLHPTPKAFTPPQDSEPPGSQQPATPQRGR